MAEKSLNTIPAPAGTYAIVDARDDAERAALVPPYARLMPVMAWHITKYDADDDGGAEDPSAWPIYMWASGPADKDNVLGFLMPDGRAVHFWSGDTVSSLEELIEEIRLAETAPTPKQLRAVGGVR